MYWKQIAIALSLAIVSGYVFIKNGSELFFAIGVGISVYAILRLMIATVFRTQYWLRRGTKGAYTTSCPDCGQYIYRRQEDWVITCYRCGWKAGIPIVRWLTHSVPSIQFRRSLSFFRIVLVLVAIGLLIAGPTATTQLNQSETVSLQSPIVIEPQKNDGSEITTTDSERVDLRQVEQTILAKTNRIRNERGLDELSKNNYLHQKALKHSRDMAQNDYYSHSGPNGQSPQSRLKQIGEKCGGVASENIHRGELYVEMRIYDSSETVFMNDAEGIAKYAVQGWMNSDGHRKNILGEWGIAGVGVYASNETVFMTILFC